MKVTPDMPREEGGTVNEHGALLDLADFLDSENQGIKVTVTLGGDWLPCVRLDTDSFRHPHSTAWLDPDDADGLADLLHARAAEARRQRYPEPWCNHDPIAVINGVCECGTRINTGLPAVSPSAQYRDMYPPEAVIYYADWLPAGTARLESLSYRGKTGMATALDTLRARLADGTVTEARITDDRGTVIFDSQNEPPITCEMDGYNEYGTPGGEGYWHCEEPAAHLGTGYLNSKPGSKPVTMRVCAEHAEDFSRILPLERLTAEQARADELALAAWETDGGASWT